MNVQKHLNSSWSMNMQWQLMGSDHSVEKYRLLYDLWMSENSVKTNKLQVLLATNAILVSAFALGQRPSPWIALAGFWFSVVWIFSIGRTVSYQQHWSKQMDKMADQNKEDTYYRIHLESVDPPPPLWGRVPSKYYLLGTPIATSFVWLVVLLYLLIK